MGRATTLYYVLCAMCYVQRAVSYGIRYVIRDTLYVIRLALCATCYELLGLGLGLYYVIRAMCYDVLLVVLLVCATCC